MSQHPAVDTIEQDTVIRRTGVITQDDMAMTASDDSVLWNLDRLDQRSVDLDKSYDPAGDGSNVDIYILDTGMRTTHEDLEGRAQYMGFDAVDELTGSNQKGVDDCNGHGTHCAGTAAGKTYGVAKKANIMNTRVLECDGSGLVSGIVLAIDKVIEQNKESGRPAVISQSLDVMDSMSLDGGIRAATAAGIVCVSAAGNQFGDSCEYSPGRVKEGIAVGASTQADEMSPITNTGECTTIMAPGESITSAWYTCDTCTHTLAGTSMATPHAAGYAAIVLSGNPDLTPAQVKQQMIDDATKDALSIQSGNVEDTPNRLLYVTSKAAAAAAAKEKTGEAARGKTETGARGKAAERKQG